MKQIKFQKIHVLKMAIPLGIAIIVLFLSFFEIFEASPSNLNRIFNAIGYFILAIHFTQTLWYKNYVSYNKKNVSIRLGRNILQERSFQYKHLKDVVKKENVIQLLYRNKEEYIDLKGFNAESQQTLFKILKNEL